MNAPRKRTAGSRYSQPLRLPILSSRSFPAPSLLSAAPLLLCVPMPLYVPLFLFVSLLMSVSMSLFVLLLMSVPLILSAALPTSVPFMHMFLSVLSLSALLFFTSFTHISLCSIITGPRSSAPWDSHRFFPLSLCRTRIPYEASGQISPFFFPDAQTASFPHEFRFPHR